MTARPQRGALAFVTLPPPPAARLCSMQTSILFRILATTATAWRIAQRSSRPQLKLIAAPK